MKLCGREEQECQCGETCTADLACMQQGDDPAGAPKLRRELSSGSGASGSQLTTAPPTPRLELQLQDLMDSDEEAVTESTPTPVSVSPQGPKDSSYCPPLSGLGSGAAPSDGDTLALQNMKGRSWQGTSVLKQEELLVNLASHLDWNMVGAKCTRSALVIWWTADRQGMWIGLSIYSTCVRVSASSLAGNVMVEMSSVCKRWLAALSSDLVWRRFYDVQFPLQERICGYNTHQERPLQVYVCVCMCVCVCVLCVVKVE